MKYFLIISVLSISVMGCVTTTAPQIANQIPNPSTQEERIAEVEGYYSLLTETNLWEYFKGPKDLLDGRVLTDEDLEKVRDAYVRADIHRNVEAPNISKIGSVHVGMTEEEMFSIIGRPSKTNTSNYGSGNQYQHIYRKRNGGAVYIYVSGGKVTAIQNY